MCCVLQRDDPEFGPFADVTVAGESADTLHALLSAVSPDLANATPPKVSTSSPRGMCTTALYFSNANLRDLWARALTVAALAMPNSCYDSGDLVAGSMAVEAYKAFATTPREAASGDGSGEFSTPHQVATSFVSSSGSGTRGKALSTQSAQLIRDLATPPREGE